jgi:hypothetical protein
VAGSGPFEEITDGLERIGDRLADAAMDLLRSAIDEGEGAAVLATKREKLLNRARSSVEKARMLVRQAEALGDES